MLPRHLLFDGKAWHVASDCSAEDRALFANPVSELKGKWGATVLSVKAEPMAEGSAMVVAASRRALSRPRLRRLAAPTRRPPWPLRPPWARRSGGGRRPGAPIAQHGVEH